MIPNAILFQQLWENSNYTPLLEECFPVHLRYCQAHKMDYVVESRTIIHEPWGGWCKYQWALEYLQDYEYVIYMDVDAVINHSEIDLRAALPEPGRIGASWHLWPHGHWNVGILYMRRGGRVAEFLQEILKRRPGPKRWADQAVFNGMGISGEWDDVLVSLPTTWNAIYKNCDTIDPIIRAYHGCGNVQERLDLMRHKAVMTLEEWECNSKSL